MEISLTRISSHKYLGLTVDAKLSWKEHTGDITAKATKSQVDLVKRTLHPCPPAAKELSCKTLVCPRLEYASEVWSPHTNRAVDKVEKVQCSPARYVTGDHHHTSSVTNMLAYLKWQILEHRMALEKLIIFSKIQHSLVKTQSHIADFLAWRSQCKNNNKKNREQLEISN